MSNSRPVRVLQFGTGMLLRGLCDACVDAANRAGHFDGAIVALQSTERGNAAALNAQRGSFTLLERGMEGDQAVERTRRIAAIASALRVNEDWVQICELAARPELRVIVSNVTEAGFWQENFRNRLVALLHERFHRLGGSAPPLFVIPTELVEENGIALAAMAAEVGRTYPDAGAFVEWLAERVRFCSSLVDRIVTGAPSAQERVRIESRLGYRDELITLCEPYHLWAIECHPPELRAAFPIDGPGTGVVFAESIAPLRERKLRLLNGAHTALAPVALQAGIETVREATQHPALGSFLEHLLFEEIAPSTTLPCAEAKIFARAVIDRFRNPWLHHAWCVIANDQAVKFRARVVPSIVGYARRFGRAPAGLALSLAVNLNFTDPGAEVERSLADETRWGANLAEIPLLAEAVDRALRILTREGAVAMLQTLELEHA